METVNGKVYTLKLISGEEIVTRFEYGAGSDTHDVIKKPMLLAMGPQGFGMMPWCLSADENRNIQLLKSAIVAITETSDMVAKQYLKQVTGIQV